MPTFLLNCSCTLTVHTQHRMQASFLSSFCTSSTFIVHSSTTQHCTLYPSIIKLALFLETKVFHCCCITLKSALIKLVFDQRYPWPSYLHFKIVYKVGFDNNIIKISKLEDNAELIQISIMLGIVILILKD